MPDSLLPLNTIHTADCLAFMAPMPDASVHLVVADPPYFRVQLAHEWNNQWPDDDLEEAEG